MKKIQDNVWVSAIVIIILVLLIMFLPNIVALFENSNNSEPIITEVTNVIKSDFNRIDKLDVNANRDKMIYMLTEKNSNDIKKILKYNKWVEATDVPAMGLDPMYIIYNNDDYMITIVEWQNEKSLVLVHSIADQDYSALYYAPKSVYKEYAEYIEKLTPLEGVTNSDAEFYYNYFLTDNGLIALLSDGLDGFSDDEMSAYATYHLKNPDFENGNTKEEYNQIAQKYFGQSIENFNNIYVKERNAKIVPTGWSFDASVFLVLKSVNNERQYEADFDCYIIPDSYFISDDENVNNNLATIKAKLLTGNDDEFDEPIRVTIAYQFLADENNDIYIKYNNIKYVKEATE